MINTCEYFGVRLSAMNDLYMHKAVIRIKFAIELYTYGVSTITDIHMNKNSEMKDRFDAQQNAVSLTRQIL